LTIKSGQTVRIDTISHQGLLTDKDPSAYFGAAGIPPGQVLEDAKEVYKTVTRPKGASAHVLTGPIYIDGAEAGDMLEVRILKVEHRVPYGVNLSNKGSGVLPGLLSGPSTTRPRPSRGAAPGPSITRPLTSASAVTGSRGTPARRGPTRAPSPPRRR
jgi:acetamidase/formamidase